MEKILSVLLGITLEILSQNLLRNPTSQPDFLPLGFLSHCLKGGSGNYLPWPRLCKAESLPGAPRLVISKDLGFQGGENKIYLALDKSSLLLLFPPMAPHPPLDLKLSSLILPYSLLWWSCFERELG